MEYPPNFGRIANQRRFVSEERNTGKKVQKNLHNDIIFYIFVPSNSQGMRRYKVNEVLKMLEADGWYLVKQKGSHRQYKHPTKKGRVTVNEKPSTTLDQFILNSIWKQAGWK